MKRNLESLEGFSMKETDGEIGTVEEFYFDDQSWTIRYLIVKTGSWFSQKKVLISPKVLKQPDWENKEFLVSLTKAQIENSPDIDTDKPVSRQNEEALSAYYTWDNYWGGDDAHGAGIFGMMPSELYESEMAQPQNVQYVPPPEGDSHLRSTAEVKGYKIHATDAEIGKVVDYIIDDATWKISHFVVECGGWLNSRNVLLPTGIITSVNWENQNVVVNISTAQVQNSPVYDNSQPLNGEYEQSLADHYKVAK